ncbi:MAG: DUF4129 domain-containing protein [Roseiflexaceae bacterium]
MFWPRLTAFLCAAIAEATLAAVVLLVMGGNAWGLLVLLALAGALADRLVQRVLPAERQQITLLALGLLASGWVAKGAALGDYGLLSGWGTLAENLLSLGRQLSAQLYATLLVACYTFWRGTRLSIDDNQSLRIWFGRALIALLLLIGLGTIGYSDQGFIAQITAEMLVFFVAGLLMLALTSALEGSRQGRLDRRGLSSVVATIGMLVGLALLIGMLLGEQAAVAVRTLGTAIAVLFATLVAPIVFLGFALAHWLLSIGGENDLSLRVSQMAEMLNQLNSEAASSSSQSATSWLGLIVNVLACLVPLVVIVALFLLSRRRIGREAARDEERESVWSWSGLSDDLRGLLAGLRRPPAPGGLRAALAGMRGGDPVSRVRRSYIQLLLRGESRQQPRRPASTPREYQEVAGEQPLARPAVERLTRAYERARYHPEATTPTDADNAERAWGEIDRADRGAGG